MIGQSAYPVAPAPGPYPGMEDDPDIESHEADPVDSAALAGSVQADSGHSDGPFESEG